MVGTNHQKWVVYDIAIPTLDGIAHLIFLYSLHVFLDDLLRKGQCVDILNKIAKGSSRLASVKLAPTSDWPRPGPVRFNIPSDPLVNVYIRYIWLVVYLPLWKIWKSVGCTIPNTYTCSKPSTSITMDFCPVSWLIHHFDWAIRYSKR